MAPGWWYSNSIIAARNSFPVIPATISAYSFSRFAASSFIATSRILLPHRDVGARAPVQRLNLACAQDDEPPVVLDQEGPRPIGCAGPERVPRGPGELVQVG